MDNGRNLRCEIDGANGAAVAEGARPAADRPLPADADQLGALAPGDGERRDRLARQPALVVAARAEVRLRRRHDVRAAAAPDALRQPGGRLGRWRELRLRMADGEPV